MSHLTGRNANYLRVQSLRHYQEILNGLTARGYFRTNKTIDKNADGSYVERLEFYSKKTNERLIYTARYNVDSNGTHNVTKYLLEVL